jgi:hypothetical protein
MKHVGEIACGSHIPVERKNSIVGKCAAASRADTFLHYIDLCSEHSSGHSVYILLHGASESNDKQFV